MSSSSANQHISNLYQEHHTWIYHWLYKKLGNSSDAADLAQDTFLRLIARENTTQLQHPRAYLTKIAKGLMVNWIQRKHVERAYLEVLTEQPDLDYPSPEHQTLIIETLTHAIQLLSELPPQVRLTFLYFQLEGLKHHQIADKLNISVSTVKRHIQCAYIHCLDAMLDLEDF